MNEGKQLQQVEAGHIGIAKALADQRCVQDDMRRVGQPRDRLAARCFAHFARRGDPDAGMGCMKGWKRQRSAHSSLCNDFAGTKGQQLSDEAIRIAAMTSKAWPYEEARKLLKRWPEGKPNGEPVLFETGYGPSGLPHIGTFNEVARTSFVRHAYEQLTGGAPTRLIAFSDDMDGLRKVPDNVPEQEMLAQHLGKPLTQIPD